MITRSLIILMLTSGTALAQNGVSDERVSLPDGPGSIGGVGENVGVSGNMGTSSFRVPIRVPQGANAVMTPSLSLGYSSGQGVGTAGIGWELPTSTIERTVNQGLPVYDTSDTFAADGGTELVYVGDLNGTRLYRARFEGSFIRYRWYNAGSGSGGYWTAEYPDGRIAWYGATAAGTNVATARVELPTGNTFRYQLVELQDTVGRRIVNTYTKDGGWPVLDEVQYGWRAGDATPRFSVRMAYEARTDIVSDAKPGYEIRLTKRLLSVNVMSSGTAVRRYTLGYESTAASGGMSRLAEVTETGRDGGTHPIKHTFGYTRTLTGVCTEGCEEPFVVDMGTLPGGVSMPSGRAALVDINGDALPDVLSTDTNGIHTFFINQLGADGHASFSLTPVVSAKTVGSTSFVLNNPGVQLIDVNGDGLTDIVSRAGGVLCNDASGDWGGTNCLGDVSGLPVFGDDPDDQRNDPLHTRFFDYDNDKRVDALVTSTLDSALVSRNTGTGYTAVTVDALGAMFDESSLELADINGDGLQDPVQIIASGATGQVLYKLNFGFGKWSAAWTTVSIDDMTAAQAASAELEDLDGDGLVDLVVVASGSISYWRNSNDAHFEAKRLIESDDVDGDIPERNGTETVLFADMNGNGTDDVVWVTTTGNVRFLELFPVRPNLMSRIENGIGWVRTIEYGTSIAERARDGGWTYPLPQSMNVVTATDSFVTATGGEGDVGVHERVEYRYADGFYDGSERAFRGFEEVERTRVTDADDRQDPEREVQSYDVGKTDPYRNSLLVGSRVFGGAGADVPIREYHSNYVDCPVDGVGSTTPPIRYICETARETLSQEGAPESDWTTVRSETEYDGYGNVTERRDLGIVLQGGGSCGPCETLPTGVTSGACGLDCLGDERTVTTTYVVPGLNTAGAWLTGLPVTTTASEGPGGSTQTTRYYDGADFVGMDAAHATRGLVTRVSRRDGATSVDTTRNAYSATGELAASLDANAVVADPTTHRREYTYDAQGLRVTRVKVRAGAYDLVQDVTYESSFLLASEATAYRVQENGTDKTPRNPTQFGYDEFGRVTSRVETGDTRENPTYTFAYELADPVSRIVGRGRTTVGAAFDHEMVICQDGRGRNIQTRKRVADGVWLVDGFSERSASGTVVRQFQPFTAASDDCDTSAPSGVPFRSVRLDALGRVVEEVSADAPIYGGTASATRIVYLPQGVASYDNEDAASGGAYEGTPTTRTVDGLERLVRIERLLSEGGTPEVFRLGYDARGNLAHVVDPAGNVKTQVFDERGNLVSAIDPNAGATTFVYDAVGNVVEKTDARGLVTKSEYDALNRRVKRFDAADEAGTAETTRFDYDPDCADCTNAAGRPVRASYPLPTGGFGSDESGYDTRGNRVVLRRTLEGHVFETTYAYDSDGEVTHATYPDGQELSYTRDGMARPTAIAGVIDAVTYTAAGQLATIVHHNGVSDALSYDVALRSARITSAKGASTLLDWTVTRDREDNVLTVVDGVSTAGHLDQSAQYAYDAHYRLVEAALTGGDAETLSYTYDALDNLTARTSSRAASTQNVGAYTYGSDDAGPNFLSTVGTTHYTSDAAGNVATKGDMQLVWDHQGRLAEATKGTSNATTMAYGVNNQRVMKTEDGGVTYYAAPDFVVRDGVASLYVKVDDRRVARLRSDALASVVLPDANSDDQIDIHDAWMGRAAAGETPQRLLRATAQRLLFEAQGDVMHLHEDLRSSIVLATDPAGAVVAERAYYPFGAERASTGFIDPIGYSGQELDASTGLLHFRSRYLDVASGRWTASDPGFTQLDAGRTSLLGQSTAGYAYVANNPIASIDPTGEVLFSLFIPKLRKTSVPFRDKKRKKSDGLSAEERLAQNQAHFEARQQNQTETGGTTNTTDTPDPTRGDQLRTKQTNKRADLAGVETRLRDLPVLALGNPAAQKQLDQERRSLEGQRKSLEKEIERLDNRIKKSDNAIGFPVGLVLDVALTASVFGSVVLGVGFGTGALDGDANDDDGSTGTGLGDVFSGGQ